MIVGSTVFKMDGNPYYSPQFPRGGLAGTFVVDVTQLVGAPTITIEIETRNSEDIVWSVVGSFTAITATGVATKDISGLQEILRFKYSFDAGDEGTDGMHFLMMAPSWRPY